MALEVEKSPLDISLNVKTECCGQWNHVDLEMEYPLLVGHGCQPLGMKDEGLLLKTAGDEEPTAVEEADHEPPDISERNKNHSSVLLMPFRRFSRIETKAECGESQPFVDRSFVDGYVPFHFSRGSLHQGDQQLIKRDPVEYSSSAEVLDSFLDRPGILPAKGVDSTFCSRTIRPSHHFDVERRGRMLFPFHSSTPKHLSGKKDTHLSPMMSATLPRTSTSFQTSEDGDIKHQEMGRSKSFSVAAALSSSETSGPWNVHPHSTLIESGTRGTGKRTPLDSCPPVGQIRKMSSFQADYWACAIPDCLPPSPDRQSPYWDPNKEYEDLLDYTYPLRPKYKLAQSPKDSTVYDSGVDLDSLSLSPDSSWKFLAAQNQERQTAGTQKMQRCSVPLLKRLECSAPVSRFSLSPIGKVSFLDGDLSVGGTGNSQRTTHGVSPKGLSPGPSGMFGLDGRDWNSSGHDCLTERDAARSNFIRSTHMLPLQAGCSRDEEYLSLPPRLKELEMLAQHLTDLSLLVAKPDHPQVQDDFPSISVNGEPLPPKRYGDGGCDKSQWELYSDSCHMYSFHERAGEDIVSSQNGKDHGSVLREMASPDSLATRYLESRESGIHHVKNEKDSCRDSLAQHIKIFCGQLEKLICWLHRIAEVTDNWIPPKPEIESVKTSLQNYLEFKKELAGHQALTEDVLKDGKMLLKHMASDSPVLQNALGLIAKQSDELENHSECFYESIVAAMDDLNAGLMKNHDAQQIITPAESSKWVKPLVDTDVCNSSLTE